MARNKVYALVSATLLASPVLGQTNYPQPIQRDNYGDWVVECFEPNDLGQECQIYQRLLINGGSAIAMVATMAYDPSNASLLMQFALPLGINIKNGAVLNIDEDVELVVPISRCTQQGCIFEGVATDGLRENFLQGKTASVTVVSPNNEPFVIPLSLSGFKEALGRLQRDVASTSPSVDNTTDLAVEDEAPADPIVDSDAATTLEAEIPLSQSPDTTGLQIEEEEVESDDTFRPVTGNSKEP